MKQETSHVSKEAGKHNVFFLPFVKDGEGFAAEFGPQPLILKGLHFFQNSDILNSENGKGGTRDRT
jgi:hypothetical protein